MSLNEIHEFSFIESLDRNTFLEKVIKGFGKSWAFSKLHSGGRLSREEIEYLRQSFEALGTPNSKDLSIDDMRRYAYDIMRRASAQF